MPTEMELTLEQTQQGVSYEVSNIRVNSFTMKMEILLEPTSNKLMVEHAEYDESNTYVLERFNTTAGNPVKKILLKLNLSDHRLFKDGGGVKEFQRSFRHSDTERLSRSDEVLKLKNFKKDATLKLFKSTNQVLSIKGGFERACVALFDQDNQTFTASLLLNLDNLEKHLDREEFQETESIGAFRVLVKQFQTLINFRYCFDDFDGAMIRKSFLEYTRTEIQQFRDTLVQHMESVKKSIDERAHHKRENNRRESNETESGRHVSSSRSRKDTHAEDADMNSVNDKQPLAEVQLTIQHDTLANEQQHSVQSDDTHLLEKVDRNTILDLTNMCHRGGEIEQNAKKCQVSCPLLDLSFDNMTTEFSNQSLESENIFLKKTVAQLQKDFSRMETHCVNMELKYQNQALKDGQHGQILNETSNKAKINKEIKVLEKINIELEHSVAKLLADNEKLHKENEHLKQTYKDLYDSIKMTRVQTKDHNDSLIAQINSKTVENADLKAQIQEKHSMIALVKVRWDSKRGPELTWERKDQMRHEIDISYTKWTKHGEEDEPSISSPKPVNATTKFVDDMDFAYIPTNGPTTLEMVNATKDNFDVDDLVKFQELLLDAEKPLYEV
ncbi:hypothetical protein Tco_0064544 [Tanacetum coccineum]